MQYRRTGPRLTVSRHSHPLHHSVSTKPQSHHLLPPWTAWTKLACLSEQTVQCCLHQRMHGVLVKPLLCLALELRIMALSAGHLMPGRWRCSFAIHHNWLWSNTGHSCLKKRKSSVHPRGFALSQTLSSMERHIFDKIPGWENLGLQQRFFKLIITSAPGHTKK